MKRSGLSIIAILIILVSVVGASLFTATFALADGFIDFEDGVEGQPIQSSIPGLQFTTTEGYDWIYGDWRTGTYNGPYPDGAYYSNGNFFAWLGPNQGSGRIDFTEGCATYLQVYVSSAYGLTADAYYSDGGLAGTASVQPNLNTGQIERLRVDAPPGDCFHYVIFHDTGNQWLIDDLSTDATGVPATRPPVIVLPGLMGSRLNVTDICDGDPENEEVWPAVKKMVVPFNTDKHLEHLRLAVNGSDPASNCDNVFVNRTSDDNTANGAIRKIDSALWPFPFEFYGPLIDHLELVGFDVYPYGYDWRLDLSDIADDLDGFINDVLDAHPDANQVNIVDHSLGGLLARHYVTSDPDRAAKVEQVISLGTPFLGAPKALKVLRWGDPLLDPIGAIGLYTRRVRDISQNSPSMYQILPTENYFDVYGQGYYRFNNGEIKTWSDTSTLIQLEHNSELAINAGYFHTDAMDDWGSTSLNVAYRIIVGSGVMSTPGILHEKDLSNWFGRNKITYDMENINGDGTVPLHSADLQGNGYDYSGGVPIWYANGVEHQDLVTEPYIMDFVAAILATPPNNAATMVQTHSDAHLPDPSVPTLYSGPLDKFSRIENSATTPPHPPELGYEPFEVAGSQISVFGIGDLHVYDPFGNHTGPTEEDRYEIGIPGSSYASIGESVFVTVPSGNIYTIVVGSKSSDSFDIRIRNIQGLDTNLIQRTITYSDAIIDPGGIAELIFNTESTDPPPDLEIDNNANGIPDEYVPPTGDVGPEGSYDRTAPVITVNLDGQKGPQGWYIGEVTITINATDGESGLAKLEFSTDNGQTIEMYDGVFTVQAEDVSLLVTKAIDFVGNEGWRSNTIGPNHLYFPIIMKTDSP